MIGNIFERLIYALLLSVRVGLIRRFWDSNIRQFGLRICFGFRYSIFGFRRIAFTPDLETLSGSSTGVERLEKLYARAVAAHPGHR
jgi:hypothetical protein